MEAKHIKPEALKKDFRSYLESGCRPIAVIVGASATGGLCSYGIKNSKSDFPNVYLDENQIVYFRLRDGSNSDILYIND